MAAYGSSDFNSVLSSSSFTITKPTGLAAGDLMVAIIAKDDSGDSNSLTTPTNWTLMDSAITGAFNQIAVYSKVADSADAAASNFTFGLASGTAHLAGVLYRITGTFSAPTCVYAIDASSTNEVSNAPDTHQIGGITPTVASSLLISFIAGLITGDVPGISTYETQTSNPTWTERHDFSSAGGYRIGTATATRTEVTATGYIQFTFSGNDDIHASESLGAILAITDTQSNSTSPSVLTSALAVQEPSLIISSTIDPAVITATININAPTVTTADPLWNNTDKPSPGSIANTDKP